MKRFMNTEQVRKPSTITHKESTSESSAKVDSKHLNNESDTDDSDKHSDGQTDESDNEEIPEKNVVQDTIPYKPNVNALHKKPRE
jgi:hypothetical protein